MHTHLPRLDKFVDDSSFVHQRGIPWWCGFLFLSYLDSKKKNVDRKIQKPQGAESTRRTERDTVRTYMIGGGLGHCGIPTTSQASDCRPSDFPAQGTPTSPPSHNNRLVSLEYMSVWSMGLLSWHLGLLVDTTHSNGHYTLNWGGGNKLQNQGGLRFILCLCLHTHIYCPWRPS